MKIELAKTQDLQEIIRLDRHVPAERLEACVQNGQVYLLRDGDRVAGVLRYSLFWQSIPFLDLIYLDAPCRNRGFGTEMMQKWESDMQKSGYEYVMTSTQSNEDAWHFYEKLGYYKAGGFYPPEQDEEEWMYVKQLGVQNPYLKNLNKIEFVVTNACTGRCKHCSEGDHTACTERIDPEVAVDAVRKIVKEYAIKTVMTFGGEPLLHPKAVFAVMQVANELQIPKRQVITNGYFSKDEAVIAKTAQTLAECGVNDLLLSVDAFHQETIPIETVRIFAQKAKENGIPTRLQPAWLVGMTHDNPYNRKTREILEGLADLEIPEGTGNVIFPEGNARKYLAAYFTDTPPENPYVEDPHDVRCVSFAPNGDVLGGNVNTCDIMEIIKHYKP